MARADITQAEDNEIQKAVWLAWPGATIEIFPSATPYAGNAVVTWPVTLIGAGSGTTPEDVVLESREEDTILTTSNAWLHRAIIVHSLSTLDAMHLRNLTLRVNATAAANQHAVFIEKPFCKCKHDPPHASTAANRIHRHRSGRAAISR